MALGTLVRLPAWISTSLFKSSWLSLLMEMFLVEVTNSVACFQSCFYFFAHVVGGKLPVLDRVIQDCRPLLAVGRVSGLCLGLLCLLCLRRRRRGLRGRRGGRRGGGRLLRLGSLRRHGKASNSRSPIPPARRTRWTKDPRRARRRCRA